MGLVDARRADSEELREIFQQYATVDKNGQKYMTDEDFVRKYLGLYAEGDYNKESVQLIAGIVDSDKDGLISFSEFQAFEGLLCVPDALYKTAFQLFDTNGNGLVTFDDFAGVMRKTALYQKLPFNLDSVFISLYFGKDKSREVTYQEFSQFLHDYHEEYGVEAFKKYDKGGTGFISAEDFKDIMMTVKIHLLTKDVKSKVISAPGLPNGEKTVSFPYFMAFNSLLNNMELIKRVYLNATKGKRHLEVTKEEFLNSSQMMSQITPFEVDILYTLVEAITGSKGLILYNQLNMITPEQYFKRVTRRITDFKAVSSPGERGLLIQILETVYRFALGSIAGAVGAAAVFPLDLVKTRMQNQRKAAPGTEVLYKSSIDCFKKVIDKEGLRGLYRGLVPQLIGVAPEKAIKLTVNDFIRDKLTDKDGHIRFVSEVFAGACAGLSQVIFTNPLEIVKIRMQVAGEVGKKVRALDIVKKLGIRGLYKGSQACMLRDVNFTAIYFSAYANIKVKFADHNGYNNPLSLLAAGAIAGIPAAALVTPADVIKTRLQVVVRKGQTSYNGISDAARKIYKEEGFKAFYKGTVARVCRSSPQFGITLATYEILQRLLYVDFGGSKPAGSEFQITTTKEDFLAKPHHIGGYKVALPVLTGLETKFGIYLPRFTFAKPP